MRIIHHQQNIVFSGDFIEVGQRRNVTIHAEYSVGDNQTPPIFTGFCDFTAQVVHIVMSVTNDGCTAQTAAIDDAGVIQLVGENDIPFADQGRNRGEIGSKAAL
jgi:hypothetical protein